MQQELFDTVQLLKPQSLVITGATKKTLTKNQQAFNKLTQNIEKLHRDLEMKQLQFDTALHIYGGEVYHVKCRLMDYQRQLVTILWEVYKSKKLTKTDQRPLRKILKDHVVELCTQVEKEPDDALKKMFAELEGESIESVLKREKEIIKIEMEEMFDELNIDIDLDGMDMNDEKAMAEKMAEIQQQLVDRQEKEQEQFERSKRKKKLTAKQEETERMRKAVDETKQKNISTIYKQLAKLFHPDLENDEERRAEKEILMKELTAAYETKNLHTLLMLELKWIHKEHDHLESLSEEKLAVYLQILKEQARDLEREIYNMYQLPRYQVLEQEFGSQVQRFPVETVKDQLRNLKNIDLSFKKDLENLQSAKALHYIKVMINQWKEAQKKSRFIDEEQEILNMILGRKFNV